MHRFAVLSGSCRRLSLAAALLLPLLTAQAGGMRLTWPTPNNAFLEGKEIEAFVQPTASGNPQSGLFGCVRNSGGRFHEGVDLLPIARDRRGDAIDPIVAVSDGVVRHISRNPGEGGYGRYIVIEHPDLVPAVYTLYAHLSAIADSIGIGTQVKRGQQIGIMGHSAGGYAIPKDRAHLHLEIGLRLSDNFDAWYARQGYGNPNRHGDYNGMNLTGFDPLEFFTAFKAGKVSQPIDFIATIPVAVTVQVNDSRVPDFVRRYPMLVEGEIPVGGPAGWEIDFSAYELPLRFRPLSGGGIGVAGGKARFVVLRTAPGIEAASCRDMIDKPRARKGQPSVVPGKDLREALELMFGVR